MPGTGQRFYRGPDNAYATASGQSGPSGQFGRGGGGGGNNRFQASGGRRPYNRGWVPSGRIRIIPTGDQIQSESRIRSAYFLYFCLLRLTNFIIRSCFLVMCIEEEF